MILEVPGLPAPGQQTGFVLRRHTEPGGRRGITCEVTDTSPVSPQPRQASTGDEHGRGQAVIAALASASGARPEACGTTSWLTLALRDRQAPALRTALLQPEPEAGA